MDKQILAHLRHHRGLISKKFKTESFVAGGALRDLDNGREIKDIDIFVPCHKSTRNFHIEQRKPANKQFSYIADLERLYRTEVRCLGENYQNWNGIRLFNILEIPHKPYPIQIIFYNHSGRLGPITLVGKFDINFCRIVDDGERTIRVAEYRSDRDNKQLTVNTDSYFIKERVKTRLKRLKAKYPDFEVPAIPNPQVQGTPLFDDEDSVTRFWRTIRLDPSIMTTNSA